MDDESEFMIGKKGRDVLFREQTDEFMTLLGFSSHFLFYLFFILLETFKYLPSLKTASENQYKWFFWTHQTVMLLMISIVLGVERSFNSYFYF